MQDSDDVMINNLNLTSNVHVLAIFANFCYANLNANNSQRMLSLNLLPWQPELMNHNKFHIAFTLYIPGDGRSTILCLGHWSLHGFEDLLKCCREVTVIKSPEGDQTLVW